MSFDFVKFILKLKNASSVRKESFYAEYSQLRKDIITLLYNEGFLQSFGLVLHPKSGMLNILITLRYIYNKSLLEDLKLLSRPSHVKYMRLIDIYNIPDRRFVVFLSTDRGLITALKCKTLKVGGKILFVC
jgi:small subunit ribosomal protein S8